MPRQSNVTVGNAMVNKEDIIMAKEKKFMTCDGNRKDC